jgi:hypothetical protein
MTTWKAAPELPLDDEELLATVEPLLEELLATTVVEAPLLDDELAATVVEAPLLEELLATTVVEAPLLEAWVVPELLLEAWVVPELLLLLVAAVEATELELLLLFPDPQPIIATAATAPTTSALVP